LVERLNSKNPDPLEQAGKLKELLGGDSALLKVLLDNQARMTELVMKQAAPAQAPAAGSLLEQLDTLTAVMDRLGGLQPRGGGAGGAGFWLELVKALPAVAAGLGTAFAAAAAGRGAGPAPAGLPVHMMPANPAETAGFALGAMAGQQAAQAAPLSIDPELSQVLEMLGISPLRLIELGRRALVAFGKGMAGSAFAETLVLLEDDGEKLYELLSAVGAEKILTVLKSAPQFAAVAGREAEISAWVADFIAYGADDEAGAQGSEGVAA
jgi:hypothetical protein